MSYSIEGTEWITSLSDADLISHMRNVMDDKCICTGYRHHRNTVLKLLDEMVQRFSDSRRPMNFKDEIS